MNEMFVDTKNMAIVKKMVKPRDQQGEFESRRSVRYVNGLNSDPLISQCRNFKYGCISWYPVLVQYLYLVCVTYFGFLHRLWQDVTYNLTHGNIDAATAAKHKLEQRQREEAKERKEAGAKWVTKVGVHSLSKCGISVVI